jgi:hypothetical protein
MRDEDKCDQFRKLWMSLLMEEKTRQRVAKPRNYDFKEHDNFNLPWKFDMAQGIKAMPVIIWIKELVEDGSSSSGWNWDGDSWRWSQ